MQTILLVHDISIVMQSCFGYLPQPSSTTKVINKTNEQILSRWGEITTGRQHRVNKNFLYTPC